MRRQHSDLLIEYEDWLNGEKSRSTPVEVQHNGDTNSFVSCVEVNCQAVQVGTHETSGQIFNGPNYRTRKFWWVDDGLEVFTTTRRIIVTVDDVLNCCLTDRAGPRTRGNVFDQCFKKGIFCRR